MPKTAVIVLAAGMGTRMKSAQPKVLHKLAGRAMVSHVLSVADALDPEQSVVVVGRGMDDVRAEVAPVATAVQDPPLGTGDAVRSALPHLEGFREGAVFILFGDTPLVKPETLLAMQDAFDGNDRPAVVVLGFRPSDAAEYGRLIVDDAGNLEKIVEFAEASDAERAVDLCNSGVMVIDAAKLPGLIDAIGNDNQKGEYYLTDIIDIARAHGWRASVVEGDAEEVLGVNSRVQLAEAESIVQRRLREQAMKDGVTLTDPESVWFSFDTKIARDVTVEPNVIFGPGVNVGEGAVIHGFSHLEGATVKANASIGPFARLRPGAEIGNGAKVGNFVEIKKATLEDGAKVNHLSYIGDALVGARANVGAGTITCNYDGFFKYRTEIGEGAFIGSNTALVAPVKVGANAIVGAGSTVTRDVQDDALALERAEQVERSGWAARFRARMSERKRKKAS